MSEQKWLVEAEEDSCALAIMLAIRETIEILIDSIGTGEDQSMPILTAIGTCARRAAWHGIPRENLLESLLLGGTILSEVVCNEAAVLPGSSIQQAIATQGMVLRRVSAVMTREYRDEQRRAIISAAEKQHTLVDRLLAGAEVDETVLDYPLDGWHIGVIAKGTHAARVIREFASVSGNRVLLAAGEAESVRGWVSARKRVSSGSVVEALEEFREGNLRLALGEPGQGRVGYCRTNGEALAAFSVALRRHPGVTFFSDVALEAMALQAPEVAKSLLEAYWSPLGGPGGLRLRETLAAYFTAQRNISSAAAALGVTRRTIENRLRVIETKLGRPVQHCGAELEVALRVDGLLDDPRP